MKAISSKNKMSSWQTQGCHFIRFDIASNNPIVIEKIFHDEISIIAFTGSTWSSRQNNRDFIERPNGVVIRDAGQVYSVRSESIDNAGAVCRELRISPERLQEIYESLGMKLPSIDFSIPTLVNPRLRTRMLKTHSVLESSSCELETSSHLTILLDAIIQQANKQESRVVLEKKCYVRDVIEYLREHYAQQINLQQLSAMTNCNPFVLMRQFRKEVGLTPHEYLYAYRVSRARHYISQGYSLTQVAQFCGFADQSHLTRIFKRKVGVTPGQFLCLQ